MTTANTIHIKKLNLCRRILIDDILITSAFTISFLLFGFL